MNSQVIVDREWFDRVHSLLYKVAHEEGENRLEAECLGPHIPRFLQSRATPAPTPVAGEGVGDVIELVHSLISGKTVSVDVSTGDDDAGNRIFATVYEVQEDVDGFVILCDDPHWNYPNVSALQADHCEDVRAMVVPDGYKLVPIMLTPEMITVDPYGMGYGRLHAVWSRLLAASPSAKGAKP